MKSRLATEPVRKALRESGERSQGLAPHLLHFAAGRAAMASIPNMRALPVMAQPLEMQDEHGNFYFIEGYSDPAGPDVHRT